MDKWQPFQLPDGSYSDDARPWSAQDVANYLPIHAEKAGTRSLVKHRTAPGLGYLTYLGSSPVRGAHDVEGKLYVIAGTALYRVFPDGTFTNLGEVPGTGRVVTAHNQVAGGNQLVIATKSNGTWVYADEGAELAAGNPGGSPGGDTGEGGGGGGGEDVIAPIAANGSEGDTELGPNGGYPDDGDPLFPLPTVLDTDLIVGGDFASSADFARWKNLNGNALDASWFLQDDALQLQGAPGVHTAYYYAGRYSMPAMPFPRYEVTVTADITCDANVTAEVGVAWGTYTTGNLPVYLDASTAATYATATTVSHTYDPIIVREGAGPGSLGQYSIINYMPVVRFTVAGTAATGRVDNVTMTITEVETTLTEATVDHLDFDSGLTGWTLFPDPTDTNQYVADMSTSGGVCIADFKSTNAPFRYIINDDPITIADAIGKYVKISGEVWCDDPDAASNNTGGPYPRGGVTFGLAYKPTGLPYNLTPGGRTQRGDFTPLEVWQRIEGVSGLTIHVCVLFQGSPDTTCKVRNLVVEVTDAVMD